MTAPHNLCRIDTDATALSPHVLPHRLILAHGAVAGINSPFLEQMAALIAARGIAVTRFAFPYMAKMQATGKRQPPSPMPALIEAYVAMIATVRNEKPGERLLIGGKSLGGRVASLIAADLAGCGISAEMLVGLVCLGYPFHPPKKPEKQRTAHLGNLALPTLIVQGTRDSLGSREDVDGYALAPNIAMHWLDDGDHDFKPRRASGHTQSEHLEAAADAVAAFVAGLSGPR